MDSGATSHMENLEDNMTNLNDTETRVTIGASRNLTGTKRVDRHGYQSLSRKLNHVMSSNTDIIPGLHNIYLV